MEIQLELGYSEEQGCLAEGYLTGESSTGDCSVGECSAEESPVLEIEVVASLLLHPHPIDLLCET